MPMFGDHPRSIKTGFGESIENAFLSWCILKLEPLLSIFPHTVFFFLSLFLFFMCKIGSILLSLNNTHHFSSILSQKHVFYDCSRVQAMAFASNLHFHLLISIWVLANGLSYVLSYKGHMTALLWSPMSGPGVRTKVKAGQLQQRKRLWRLTFQHILRVK